MAPPSPFKVLLGVTGSVAAMHVAALTRSLSEWAEVRVVLTRSAWKYVDRAAVPRQVIVYSDEDEWNSWKRLGDPLLHVVLRNWADAMLIAPLSGHTLAKITAGLSNNLLTLIVRGWNPSKAIYIAPCMHREEWENPLTSRQIQELHERGLMSIAGRNGALEDITVLEDKLRDYHLLN